MRRQIFIQLARAQVFFAIALRFIARKLVTSPKFGGENTKKHRATDYFIGFTVRGPAKIGFM